ncbi:MAG: hypothetical protein Sapg2KO_34900 [Saprospiraceae bacterium]
MPPISIIHLQFSASGSVSTTKEIGLPKTKEMEYKTRKLSKEKLLLALIIGFGCYGFSLNFHPNNQREQSTQLLIHHYLESEIEKEWKDLGPLKMEGTFLVGDPIRFTLTNKKWRDKDIEIDFGNGIQKHLSEPVFTYAYRDQGQFELKIKQKGRVFFQTRLYITASDQLAMN